MSAPPESQQPNAVKAGWWGVPAIIVLLAAIVYCAWPGMTAPLFSDDLPQLDRALRREKAIEVPIPPSPRVSPHAIRNSFAVLFHYAILRFTGRPAKL